MTLAVLLNIPLALLLSRGYLGTVPEGTTTLGWTATLTAWMSNTVMLGTVIWLLLLPAVLLFPRRWAWAILVVAAGFLAQVALVGDVVIYGLFRTHYNHMVWLALTTPGANDSIDIGMGTVIEIAVTVIAILIAQIAIAWACLRPWARPRGWRVATVVATSVLLLALCDKSLFLYGSLTRRPEITRIEQLFPLYQPVHMSRFAVRMGWMDPETRVRMDPAAGTALQYPLQPIPLPEQPRRLNIIIIAIEGARQDMVDPTVMPNLHRLAERATWCRQHWSAGNATRFGIFGVFYGIHSTMWPGVLAERRQPVLMGVLDSLGYRMRIDSCTNLNFPEFRQTVFVGHPDHIHDQWDDPGIPRMERDRIITDRAVDFIGADDPQPFFSFLFYDSTHAPYRYPDEHAVFQPTEKLANINFMRISRSAEHAALKPLFNRYRNSLHYVDSQIGRVVAAVESSGKWEDTAIVVVGDHGEEFGENGYYGHNGTFSPYQAGAACVVHLPGLAAGVIDRLTSHVDIPPTLLTALGIQAPLAWYTDGVPLQDSQPRAHVVVSSWDTLGLVDGDGVLVLGTRGYNHRAEVLDHQGAPFPDQRTAIAARQRWTIELMQAMRRFSR